MRLSTLERKILSCIQQDLPITEQPFKVLSKQLGIKEQDLLGKIKQLKDKGVIRSFSAGLSHRKLGFKSSLIGLRIPAKKVNAIARKIIVYPEVTHCFLRQNEYNLWSVVIYKNGMLKNFLKKLAHEVGRGNILNLPTKRQFKLKTRVRL